MSFGYVIYGGQYGSEGKASAAEYWARQILAKKKRLVVIGENSPNSGHTCSLGATKNIPAASFFADEVLLGPDSVIDPEVLISDWEKVGRKELYIHENAALLTPDCKAAELDIVRRISSTGSGSGAARKNKFIDRNIQSVVKSYKFPKGIKVLSTDEYLSYLSTIADCARIFECSQGALLDCNFGIYPYVTSRSTLPQAAVARNGLGWMDWSYYGVYRTYPIRTGGPSGPTGGGELDWKSLNQQPEIATVTKRKRRVFEFSAKDFCRSFSLTQPNVVMFTFLDYLEIRDLNDLRDFEEWLEYHNFDTLIRETPVYVSNTTGNFVEYK